MKITNKLYRVIWEDITSHDDTELDKPLRELLTERESVGYLVEDKDCIGLIHLRDKGNVYDFIVIPKSLVKKMICVK